ncbi:Lrp/AsnC ligand binding domain-containing protein [Sphingopyxis sp.]|uniref:Lrp/AsnC ligand binding domain-containing protein n=1 Tax=Sphingopyxis sp. TaxID=1908224 RepID=UPI002B49E1F0|nr:Lrp/AsnC ligand binding domain-containing protein [Sphingopyxis sp.]HJS11661.1 Lrp/AsnC ligand binding domain-containing protein [Sphingopyxis sp.]HKY81689.1 Lrp/AsnC ligand binding domain-containing protein [Sphingobium sp.]
MRQHNLRFTQLAENLFRAMLLARHSYSPSSSKISSILDHSEGGRSDYLLRVLVASLKDYERFVRAELHAVPGVASIDTSVAYGQVKKKMVYPAPQGA